MTDCKKCDNKAGLSILLVRPTAISTDDAFAPPEAAKLLPHEPSVTALKLPALKQNRHALRMLRRGGFVYAWYTKRPRQLVNDWQVFRVHESGALIPASQVNWADQKCKFACNAKDSHPHDLRTLCIQLPHNHLDSIGPVWIGFSMNWWNNGMRERVRKDPAAAGMVCIDPLAELGGVKNAFKADAFLIQQHVADFALRVLDHGGVKQGINLVDGGTSSATPFYDAEGDKSYRQAAGLVAVMQKQAAQHPKTKGKEFVLAIPDPVGLAADLNGIRMAKDDANQQTWNSTEAWTRSEACYGTLEGLRKALTVAGMIQSREWATAASENQWNGIKHRVHGMYEWSPDVSGAYANDGSRAGHMRPVGPEATRTSDRIKTRGVMFGRRNWERITDQLDMDSYNGWPAKRASIEKQLADALAPYEADWLAAIDSNAFRAYFKTHFDADDAAELTARVSSGLIYAGESYIAHFPQPAVRQHTERWTGIILDKDIEDPAAIALRGFYGNQRSVITKVKALLVGNADRGATAAKDGQGEISDIRDKSYDVLKGIVTHDLGKSLNWLHPRLMAFSAGGLAASATGVFQLMAMAGGKSPAPASGSIKKYQAMLPGLCAGARQLELAVEATRPGGNKAVLSTVVRLKTRVSVDVALSVLGGYATRDALRKTIVTAQGNTVELEVLTDIKTALEIHEGHLRPETVPGQRVNVAHIGGAAAKSLEDVQMQSARLNRTHALTPEEVAEVMRRQATQKDLGLTTIDGRLAVGAMIVQFLGLYQGVPQLLSELNKSQRDQDKLAEAALGVADSVGGFVGAAAERLAAAHKSSLLMRAAGGEELVEASTRIAVLRTAAAITGVLGAGINAYLMALKAEGAQKEGDANSGAGYIYSSRLFVGIGVSNGIMAADAATKGMVTRAIAKHVVLRLAGAAATEAAVAGTAGVVASVVSGVGIVLLVAGVATYVYAVVSERDSYMRWAGRCYFGKDTVKRFGKASEEEAWLLAIEYETDTQEDVRRKAQAHPDPGRGESAPRIDNARDRG
ncbi:T6SS effector BTH_I2691 family protein [Variovorax ginsengisoli]|uniref:Toxin VasX N-terminal region domain-containing protein n=1 Tax=Variovorax ginsengisoli TaxID=363844 RepID=A0ABT9SC10_9BURK|nr:T6SS effector BTH_I2691 family protein [Variovorax ginsengisoli]MDP9901884.1 hypothetical protein [Variovorax ginsengisoli]